MGRGEVGVGVGRRRWGCLGGGGCYTVSVRLPQATHHVGSLVESESHEPLP